MNDILQARQLSAEQAELELRRRIARELSALDANWSRSKEGVEPQTLRGDWVGVLPTWDWARFSNEEWRRLVDPRVLAAAEAWTPDAGNLGLLGPTGAGKSSAALALVCKLYADTRRAIEAGKDACAPDFIWASGPELVAAERGHALGDGLCRLTVAACRRGLCVLDEIGHEPPAGTDLVFAILDARYRDGLLTICTSGLTRSEWIARYGAAAWRRLTEGGSYVDAHRPQGQEGKE